jgi:hypothetical protein
VILIGSKALQGAQENIGRNIFGRGGIVGPTPHVAVDLIDMPIIEFTDRGRIILLRLLDQLTFISVPHDRLVTSLLSCIHYTALGKLKDTANTVSCTNRPAGAI